MYAVLTYQKKQYLRMYNYILKHVFIQKLNLLFYMQDISQMFDIFKYIFDVCLCIIQIDTVYSIKYYAKL